jgi:hypothetical protein
MLSLWCFVSVVGKATLRSTITQVDHCLEIAFMQVEGAKSLQSLWELMQQREPKRCNE